MKTLGLMFMLVLPAIVEGQDRERKQARASKVADGAIRVDGRLSEDAWRSAVPIVDFVQREPSEGAPATDRTEVRFVFDGAALYVGARMRSTLPIQAPLGRRDEGDQAEHLQVSLDTYLDRRTATTFGVTATGVRLDHFHASDNESSDDPTFNPVWQARTSIDADGWTAELWIPFSQLRFNERTPQIWGLNVRRWVPSRNEDAFWSPMLRTDQRWASLFGDLRGLDGIRPTRRLELLPYVAGGSRLAGAHRSDDPFSSGANFDGRVGGDAKMGIGSNMTLEATVNPDFGQVEADPAEVNLSAFETFFEERRPFFVEGANLLMGNVNNYFYSRRIGAAPTGRATGDFVEYPGTTTILGAAKLTGRLESRTSVGVLGALTGEETARTFSSLQFGRVRVAPRTAYGVARVSQEFGPPGSTVGFMTTMVHRPLSAGDPLTAVLTRNALTFSGDSVMRFGDYELQGFLGVAHVDGEPGALQRLQRSSARYYQRPDVDYVTFDPIRTSMNGSKGGVSLERQNARHWLWQASAQFETPGFETNDVGRLTSSDGLTLNGQVEYQETTPGRWFRAYSITAGQGQEWNYGGDHQIARVFSNAGITWPNFWQAELDASLNFRVQDMRLTRGGPSMEVPQGWQTSLRIEGSEAAQTRASVDVTYGRTEDGGGVVAFETGVSTRPSPRWQLSLTPIFRREIDTEQYIRTLPGGGPATFGGRYIFGRVDRSTYSAQLRLNYTFKPDLNLDFYGEPFVASGQYDRIGELAAAGGRQLLPIDAAAPGVEAPDFHVRSFRSNLVLRWEWRRGSTLYFVWQQDREQLGPVRDRVSAGDLFRSFGIPGDNFLALKASFWFSPN